MIDASAVAGLFNALSEIPQRMAAVEQQLAGIQSRLRRIEDGLPAQLLTISEAAAAFHVSIPTMRRWVRSGSVPIVRIGGTVRVQIAKITPVTGAGVSSEALRARGALPVPALSSSRG